MILDSYTPAYVTARVKRMTASASELTRYRTSDKRIKRRSAHWLDAVDGATKRYGSMAFDPATGDCCFRDYVGPSLYFKKSAHLYRDIARSMASSGDAPPQLLLLAEFVDTAQEQVKIQAETWRLHQVYSAVPKPPIPELSKAFLAKRIRKS